MKPAGIEPARGLKFWSQDNADVITRITKCDNARILGDPRIAQPDLANGARFQVQMKKR